jgi:cytochrome c553
MTYFTASILSLSIVVILSPHAHGQTHTHQPIDTIEQRVIACTACHGAQGKATPDGYFPRIAGKPEGYLYHQLLYFRDGKRHNTTMRYMLRGLSDSYLKEMAHYFAGLQLPYPSPYPEKLSEHATRTAKKLVYHGDAQRSIPACIACHNTSLMGTHPNIPSLLGLPHHYLSAQLNAWSQNTRHASHPDCMAHIANQLTGDEISAISTWLSLQPVPHNLPANNNTTLILPLPCGMPTP